ncbi:hypothetical protein ACFYR1_47015 [Streptomyces canus]|uniref:hypothetical protein n=1 Tax=Streptomyces canus TaxID=58343 RepID=UPI00367F4AC9
MAESGDGFGHGPGSLRYAARSSDAWVHCRPHVSDRRGNTVQISPPFIATDDEVRRLVAAIDTVLSAQEAK